MAEVCWYDIYIELVSRFQDSKADVDIHLNQDG